jgi:transposase
MARTRKYVVCLTDEEVERIRKKAKRKNTPATIKDRCNILLDMDENHSPSIKQKDCASKHGVTQKTVVNTVRQFCTEGLDSVLKLKRSVNSDQARRKVDGRIEARLIEIACSPAPEGHSRWTIRLLEDEMKVILDEPISREAIRRTLKKST